MSIGQELYLHTHITSDSILKADLKIISKDFSVNFLKSFTSVFFRSHFSEVCYSEYLCSIGSV